MRKIFFLLVLLALVVMFVAPAVGQDDDTTAEVAHIRVAHFSPDAGGVDVYLDGELSDVQALEFSSVTDWIEVPAGTYSVVVSRTGTSIEDSVIGPADLTFDAGTWTTIAAVGSLEDGSFAPAIISENYGDIGLGNARVGVFHAFEGAPAVDVLADGSPIVTQLGYPGSQGSNDGFFEVEVPGGVYNLQVVETGTTDPVLLDLPGTELAANSSYLIVVTGGAEGPTAVVQSVAQANSIADVLLADGRFSTLVAALDAAGLTQTLDQGGPFTVFAPTNGAFEAAFEALGVSAEEALANTELLTTLLTYHVVEGATLAADVAGLDSATTLQGEDISISEGSFGVVLNDNVNVTRADIQAANGVIHIINQVLVPPSVSGGMGAGEEAPSEVTEETEPEATPEVTEEAEPEVTPEAEVTPEPTADPTN